MLKSASGGFYLWIGITREPIMLQLVRKLAECEFKLLPKSVFSGGEIPELLYV